SNNSVIHTSDALNMHANFNLINLKNANTIPNMIIRTGFEPWGSAEPEDPPYASACIIVDNATLANNNQYPNSEWTIYHPYQNYPYANNTEDCFLSSESYTQNKIKVHPNPVSDLLYFDANTTIEKIIVFDLSGRKIMEQNQVNTISVSNLQKGNYILKIFSDKGVQTEKIIVK